MKKYSAVLESVSLIMLGTALLNSLPAKGAERNLTRTNWTERWITNLIEVRMPKNVFVDEYHTNWTQQYVTNVVEVFATNWLNQKVTNTIPVKATRNVQVSEYRTNWNTVTLTNRVPVQLVRTNFVDLRQTNWETGPVMKTNWITQPVTNVVNIDLIHNRAPAKEVTTVASPVQEIPVQPLPQATSTLSDSIKFEASRTSRPPNRNVVELLVKARWVADSDLQLQVRQWRVESEDGAILCHSQDQDFRRELPAGRYRIEVKAHKDANSPLLAARGIVDLNASSATMLPLTSSR